MKLKGILGTLMLTLFIGSSAMAQDSTNVATDDCQKFRSLYYQYLTSKAYQDAANFWNDAVVACGPAGLDGDFYANGRYIYSMMLREEGITPERKAAIQDTILWVYEGRMKIDQDLAWAADYASQLVTNKSKDHAKIDTLFAQSIPGLKDKAKSKHYKQYFKHLIINKFNSAEGEEKEAARTTIIEEYIVLSEYIGSAIKNAEAAENENEIKRQTSAQSFLDKYFLQIAKDCDVLVGVFDKKFDTLPTDTTKRKEKVNAYLALMDQKKCQSSAVYGKFVDELIRLEPTAEAHFFGGNYALSNGDKSKAADYFQKAVEIEGDGENKDKYLLNLANIKYKQGSYRSAFNTAKGIGGEYRANGLVICANSIAATANDCGESTFARKANYWLANDYIKKAIAAGKTGVSSSQFLKNAPDSNEAFNEGVSAGSSVSLSCWGESTTARF
ncbi:MAG: hypothetical protein GQ574_15760 [Crocinitomix sp.]|nr:hypothetical protein [Crocinitomix sp.]